jgi:phosphohistidine swiveling domain-containing protein
MAKTVFEHPDFTKQEEWFHLDRTGAPFFLDAYLRTWGMEKPKKFEKMYYPCGDLEDAYLLFQGERFYGRWWSMKKAATSILEYLVQDDNFAAYLKNKDMFMAKMDKVWKDYPREKVLAMGKKEALEFVHARQDDTIESWITNAIAPYIGEIASLYLDWWFEKRGITGAEKDRLFHLVFAYPKVSATIERQLDIRKRLDAAKDQTEKAIALKQLVIDHAYAKSDFIGYVPYGEEDVLKEYEAVKSIELRVEEEYAEREAALKELKLTTIERTIFDVFAFSSFSRDERRAYQQRLFAMLDWGLEALAGHYGIKHEVLRYATTDELSDKNLSDPAYKKLLQERYDKGFMILWHTRGTGGYLSGAEAWKKFESLDELKVGKVTEIKGQPTYKGKVTGVVKIIMNPKIPTPEGPFILVTGMTSPDYIHYMQKCAAIVTNEGGITCHAAILSRELKKPCLIGTKIATKVLKDGDMVEVDAEQGIIRILS